MNSDRFRGISRRTVLRTGLAVPAVGLTPVTLAACSHEDDSTEFFRPHRESALRQAAAARALQATSGAPAAALSLVAEIRDAHAAALTTLIGDDGGASGDDAGTSSTTPSDAPSSARSGAGAVPSGGPSTVPALVTELRTSGAATLTDLSSTPSIGGYAAGMLASVGASCLALTEVFP